MKSILRVIALSSIVPAFLAGNSLTKSKAAETDKNFTSFQPAAVPGPVPTCNPLTQNCPNIRGK